MLHVEYILGLAVDCTSGVGTTGALEAGAPVKKSAVTLLVGYALILVHAHITHFQAPRADRTDTCWKQK